MSDSRLGIGVAVTGVNEARSQLQTLEAQLRQIHATAQLLEASTSRPSYLRLSGADQMKAQLETLRQTVGRWDAAQASLGRYDAAMQTHEKNISRVITAQRALSTAAEDFATRDTSRIIQAQRGLDSYIAAQERARAVEERAVQRAESTTATRVISGGRAVDRMEAQRAKRVSDMINTMAAEQTARQSEMYPGSFLSTRQIVQARRSVEDMENKVRNTMRRFEREAEEAGEVAGQGFWSRFMRGGRTPMSLVDEAMRGQRGAMVSTVGSGFKAAGGGAGIGLAAIGGVVAVSEVMHTAEAMGKLNQSIKAASETTGMSVRQFAQLQGAMILTGSKADSADASIRHFAGQLEKAMANPASEAAKALHAVGISQDELKTKGSDTYQMMERVGQALNQFVGDSTKAAFLEEMFGRGDASLARFLSRFSELIPQTENYANAVDKFNAKWIETDEKLNKLTLDWNTLKESLAEPVDVIINVVIKGLDELKSLSGYIGQALGRTPFGVFGRFGGQMYDYFHPHAEAQLPEVDVSAAAPKRHMAPFSTPKGRSGGGHMPSAFKEEEANIESLRQKLRELQDQYRLFSEQQDASVEHQKIAARIQQADKNISPVQRAQEDYKIAQSSGAQKIAELQKLSSASASIYAQMLGDTKKQYEEDQSVFTGAVKNKQEALNKLTMAQKEYNRILGEANKSQIDFQVQIQKVQNQVDREFMGVAEAHQQEVQKVISQWGNAFDQIGDKLVSTIGEAIKSAFIPLKPEYWWSSSTGPRGQPLMHAHRIDPTLQMFSGLGMSAAQDLGKTVLGSLGTSISKSIFGAGTSSFGEGLAKMIGIGGPGGLLGTGLGAVASVTAQTPEITAITAGSTAIVTAITTTGAAQSAILSSILAADTASAVKPSVLGTTYSTGGIVMAAGGYSVPRSFGTDTVPAMLTPGETVLPVGERPSQISAAMQNMNRGNVNLHFHGPADAPSISRWFRENMTRNSGAVRSMFRNNALTPRSL